MFVPPCRIDTYENTPELSNESVPPYNPLASEDGIPSICSGTDPAEIGAYPRITTPPQIPCTSSSKFGETNSPTPMESITLVKIIGAPAVPSAIIFEPRAITNADAVDPTPDFALIKHPGSIVKTAPLITDIRPCNV